jgi:hypothetical protein
MADHRLLRFRLAVDIFNDGTAGFAPPHGAFAEPVLVLTGASGSFQLRDIDGDEDTDLVLTNHTTDRLTTLTNETVTGVAEGVGDDAGIAFSIVGPNPMRNGTAFAYSVERVSPVRVTVFDVVGRRVRTLVEGVSSAGVNRVTWDARDDAGRPVGSGVYFVRFASDGGHATERLTAIR